MKVFQVTGMPLDTKKVASTDTAQGLPTAYMGAAATRITETNFTRGAYAVLITCESQPIRFTYNGVTPTNDAGTAVGHVLAADASILLDGEEQVNGFKFISKVGGSHAALQITPYIAMGR